MTRLAVRHRRDVDLPSCVDEDVVCECPCEYLCICKNIIHMFQWEISVLRVKVSPALQPNSEQTPAGVQSISKIRGNSRILVPGGLI